MKDACRASTSLAVNLIFMAKPSSLLVPTDFSAAALNAYHFALQLAPELQASVELIHVYSGSHDLGQPLVLSPGKGRAEVLESWLEDFAQQRPALSQGVHVQYKLIQGLVEPALIEQSKSKDVQFIVMGATGSSRLVRKLFGSVSEAVSLRAMCPTILVPKDYAYQGVRNITYACEWDSLGQAEFEQIQQLAQVFHAEFHFVHVQPDQEPSAQTIDFQEALCNYLTEQGTGFAFTISSIRGDSVSEQLLNYLETHPTDLIILATHRRTFWQRFTSKSTTKPMISLSKTPMMVFHLGD